MFWLQNKSSREYISQVDLNWIEIESCHIFFLCVVISYHVCQVILKIKCYVIKRQTGSVVVLVPRCRQVKLSVSGWECARVRRHTEDFGSFHQNHSRFLPYCLAWSTNTACRPRRWTRVAVTGRGHTSSPMLASRAASVSRATRSDPARERITTRNIFWEPDNDVTP